MTMKSYEAAAASSAVSQVYYHHIIALLFLGSLYELYHHSPTINVNS